MRNAANVVGVVLTEERPSVRSGAVVTPTRINPPRDGLSVAFLRDYSFVQDTVEFSKRLEEVNPQRSYCSG